MPVTTGCMHDRIQTRHKDAQIASTHTKGVLRRSSRPAARQKGTGRSVRCRDRPPVARSCSRSGCVLAVRGQEPPEPQARKSRGAVKDGSCPCVGPSSTPASTSTTGNVGFTMLRWRTCGRLSSSVSHLSYSRSFVAAPEPRRHRTWCKRCSAWPEFNGHRPKPTGGERESSSGRSASLGAGTRTSGGRFRTTS
jgi:hypothetical protein